MIGLCIVCSTVGKQKEIGKQTKERVLKALKGVKNIKFLGLINEIKEAKNIAKGCKNEISGCIVAVATGGTSRIIKVLAESFKKPMLIWANPFNNSLASSLEAFSQLKQKREVKLFYSAIQPNAINEINKFIDVCEAINKLENSRIGCIGKPTKWILNPKNRKAINKLGPKILELKIEELINAISRAEDEIKNIYNKLKKSFGKIEVSERDLVNAIKVYIALKQLISKYILSAVTIKCFDLLAYNYTACLGVSLCNDEGIIAGCEADVQALLTMMVVSFITNKPCWMANPSRIDKDKNTITLAHCTIATKMISNMQKAALLPHMESGKCVAIRGPLKHKEVTLVRLGGKHLDKMLIAPGRIIKSNMKEPNLCRTQVEVELNGSVNDLIENALGNHLILTYGKVEPSLVDFCKFKGINPVLIK